VRTTYITATVIAALSLLWILSGVVGKPDTVVNETLADRNALREASVEDRVATKVRARIVRAEAQTTKVMIRGRTENKRTVAVKAETNGRIESRPIEKGTRVAAGDLLCRISIDDREAKVIEAREALKQAHIEHQGSVRLAKQGLISDTLTATTKAKLAATEAQLARSQLDLAHTYIRAPFGGLIEDTHVEIGDFVQAGNACATIVDLDPMLLVGGVAEREVHKLRLGSTATGVMIDGREITGEVTFVGQQSDAVTRTYRVEIQVPNPDFDVRSGVTTDIRVPTDVVLVHRVPPSLLTLDDAGNIGVRTLDAETRVEFHQIEIIEDAGRAIWITGLPEVTTLITAGQELVVPGERVEVNFEAPDELPAAAPEAGTEHKIETPARDEVTDTETVVALKHTA
jgi:multidrug efflux system membrane fusion protein